ncbi:MAG: hypothetical protein KIT84_07360 [Labilithrix sp.]|nr:hypothetical protein [Labilithrix sp.]MCW5810813.1 hypothetical protein [Labilithrix sp.]
MGRTERELRRRRKGWHTLFFVLVLLPMLVVFPYIRVVNNPNEFVRVFTTMSLVENGSYRIDEQVATFGWANDMARTKGKDDGVEHYYMVKAPGVVYLGIPGYVVFSKIVAPLLGKEYPGVHAKHVTASTNEDKLWWLQMSTWSMRLSASQIPCFLFLLWLERYLRAFTSDPAIRYAAVTAAGLGTNFLAYTHMFASHSQYAAIAFLAFATIESEVRRAKGDVRAMRPSRAFFAGFCTSACVALEYQALFMTFVMTIFATFAFWRPFSALAWLSGLVFKGARRLVPLGTSVTPTRILAFGAGGLLNVPHVMYFHWAAYNNPFTPGHQSLETAHFAAEHKQGLWGILWPSWDHVKALAIDPSFGFFGMSPFMWIGLVGVAVLVVAPFGPASRRSHLRWISIVWLTCMSVVIGVNAGFVEWRAGWTVGPRYLVVCAPFFAFGSAVALERFSHKNRTRRAMARGMAGGLALASVLAIGTVGLTYDTLPTEIGRPFAQFAVPMARLGSVPHHVGEWFGWSTTTLWYVALAALLLAPFVAALAPQQDERRSDTVLRVATFFAAAAAGMAAQVTPPEDNTPLWVIHPSTQGIQAAMEPVGRDRLTKYREQADRYGLRGIGPCLWHRVAALEHVAGQEAKSKLTEARVRAIVPKERCLRRWL